MRRNSLYTLSISFLFGLNCRYNIPALKFRFGLLEIRKVSFINPTRPIWALSSLFNAHSHSNLPLRRLWINVQAFCAMRVKQNRHLLPRPNISKPRVKKSSPSDIYTGRTPFSCIFRWNGKLYLGAWRITFTWSNSHVSQYEGRAFYTLQFVISHGVSWQVQVGLRFFLYFRFVLAGGCEGVFLLTGKMKIKYFLLFSCVYNIYVLVQYLSRKYGTMKPGYRIIFFLNFVLCPWLALKRWADILTQFIALLKRTPCIKRTVESSKIYQFPYLL